MIKFIGSKIQLERILAVCSWEKNRRKGTADLKSMSKFLEKALKKIKLKDDAYGESKKDTSHYISFRHSLPSPSFCLNVISSLAIFLNYPLLLSTTYCLAAWEPISAPEEQKKLGVADGITNQKDPTSDNFANNKKITKNGGKC